MTRFLFRASAGTAVCFALLLAAPGHAGWKGRPDKSTDKDSVFIGVDELKLTGGATPGAATLTTPTLTITLEPDYYRGVV